jgi:hypothetical protein
MINVGQRYSALFQELQGYCLLRLNSHSCFTDTYRAVRPSMPRQLFSPNPPAEVSPEEKVE